MTFLMTLLDSETDSVCASSSIHKPRSIDAMEDESRENSDIDSLDVHEMAAVKDDGMKAFLRDKMSEGLPAVCDSLDAD
jgi:hypothetical protein